MQFFETSAKDGTNVNASFAALARVAAEAQLLLPGGGAAATVEQHKGAVAGNKKECSVQ